MPQSRLRAATPRCYWCVQRCQQAATNEASPKVGADGGKQGALPAVTSGPFCGTLPWKPYFHPCGFLGGLLLPFRFFLLRGGGGAWPAPPLAIPATLGLSGPQFTFPCLPFPHGLGCRPSGRCTLSQPCTPTLTSVCAAASSPQRRAVPLLVSPRRAVTLANLGCAPGSALKGGFPAAGQVPPALQCADTAL